MQPDWAKVLGEMLADYEIAQRGQLEPLALRLAELEKTQALSPDVAEQVASAVRLLHETPPLEQRAQPSMPSRVTRIERDGDGFRVTHES